MMDNPALIIAEIERISSTSQLILKNPDLIEKQIGDLELNTNQLVEIKNEVKPFLIILQNKIVELNAIRLAKGAVGLALMVFTDSDDSSSGFIDSMISQIGEDLFNEAVDGWFRESVRDESGLKNIVQTLEQICQNIEIKINENNKLREIGIFCLNSPKIQTALINQSLNSSPRGLLESFENFSHQIKFVLVNQSCHQLEQQIQDISKHLEKIKQINETAKSLSESLLSCQNLDDKDYKILETLFSLFGGSISKITYNGNSLNFSFGVENYTYDSVLSFSQSLQDKSYHVIQLSQSLQRLINDCLNSQKALNLLSLGSSQEALISTGSFSEESYLTVDLLLSMESVNQFKQQIAQLHLNYKKLKELNSILSIATQKYRQKLNFPVTHTTLAALIELLGKSIKSISLTPSGDLMIKIDEDNMNLKDFMESLCKKQELLKPCILQIKLLINLGIDLEKNKHLEKLVNDHHTWDNLDHLKNQIKSFRKKSNIDLDFDKLANLQKQTAEIKKDSVDLKVLVSQLNILTESEFEKGLLLNSININAIYSLFGRIKFITFTSQQKPLIIFDKFKYTSAEISSKSNKLKKEVEKIIASISNLITLAEQCLKDTDFRKQVAKQKQIKNLQMKGLVCASVLAFVTPLSWIGWNFSYSYYTLLKAENIIKDEQLNNTQDINQLKSQRVQLQNAQNLLTTIPKSLGSRYQEAQADLQNLEQSLINVNQRIELEENSRQNFTFGLQLFNEVEKSFPTLSGKSQRIKEADEKLETVIGLLQSVHSQAQVFNQVEAPLNKAQVLRGLLKNHIQSLNQLELVNYQAMEASKLVQNPPHSVETWKQAKDKWDEAIRLLSEIVVDEEEIKIQVQQKLKTYQANSKMIESQIANEEKALNNWQQSLNLGNEVAQMVQNSPHPSVVWEAAQSKCETAVKGLLSIPPKTSVYSQAQNKLKTYQGNCAVFRQKKKTEENYERIINNAKETLSLIKTNLQKTPHTIQKLNLAVSQIEQAIKLLEIFPSETDSLQQAQELQVTLVKYQNKINETLEEIARCQTNSFYTQYCFELNMPIYLDYSDRTI